MASAISGKSGPTSSRTAATRSTSSDSRSRPHLHLDCTEAAFQKAPRLIPERVEGEVEIDTAGVGRHLAPVPAEKAPQRLAAPPPLEVPQGDVERGDGERGHAAAPAEVRMPPHPVPQPVDIPGVVTSEQRGEVVLDQGVDRPRSDVVDGVGVADAFPAVRVAHPRHDEPGVADVAVGGVRHDDRKGDAVVVDFDGSDTTHFGSFRADHSASPVRAFHPAMVSPSFRRGN